MGRESRPSNSADTTTTIHQNRSHLQVTLYSTLHNLFDQKPAHCYCLLWHPNHQKHFYTDNGGPNPDLSTKYCCWWWGEAVGECICFVLEQLLRVLPKSAIHKLLWTPAQTIIVRH